MTWCCPCFYGKKYIPDVFKFSDLISYELLEDGESVTKGGLGSAIVGGALFGGVGAIVGGGLGKKQKSFCTSMGVMVSVNHPFFSTFQITLISGQTKTGSIIYRTAKDTANKLVALFSVISNYASSSSEAVVGTLSAADEIKKYKELLDIGAISQEEFEQKKKQLLGL